MTGKVKRCEGLRLQNQNPENVLPDEGANGAREPTNFMDRVRAYRGRKGRSSKSSDPVISEGPLAQGMGRPSQQDFKAGLPEFFAEVSEAKASASLRQADPDSQAKVLPWLIISERIFEPSLSLCCPLQELLDAEADSKSVCKEPFASYSQKQGLYHPITS